MLRHSWPFEALPPGHESLLWNTLEHIWQKLRLNIAQSQAYGRY